LQSKYFQTSFNRQEPLFDNPLELSKGRLFEFSLGRQQQLLADEVVIEEQKTFRDVGLGSLAKTDLEGKELGDFYKVDRNIMIMTTAGKPVFC
jgi:hypothetical protein